jgi:two-component system CheB/CheR fusion protein
MFHEEAVAVEGFPIVGVGASAGGLQALEGFFRAMPRDPGMAFVIVMHLAPDRESLLAEILASHIGMTVEVARDGQLVEQNKVYVLPPNAVLTISNKRLWLRKTDAIHHERAPIDIFFASLAKDQGEFAVGVVLSGSGSDGVLGVKAIKEHGGMTLAQTGDFSGPGFAGMPDSAIASGLIDFAIPVETMAARLAESVGGIREFGDVATERRTRHDDHVLADALDAIYSILRDQRGHDFSGYKKRSFMRRIHRRMQIHQCKNIADYVEQLRRDAGEVTLLFRDLLINVTGFLRDPEAFDALRETVIPRLFEGRGPSDTVRVWAPGCSTGEEVVSIAILLREHMDTLSAAPRVTIFATDIDEPALVAARAGRYPEALMENVSRERRQRFFVAEASSYVVAKPLRDLCIFSSHSILRDPPFSRMDLISCRNLLIYFGIEAQRQVFPILHYALRPGGFLFLGKSESIGRFTDLFAPLDKKNCLFQARDTGRAARMPLLAGGLHPSPFAVHLPDRTNVRAGSQLRQLVEARVAERFAPPHVVVNEESDIVYFSARTGKYLEAPPGAPSRQLLTMARKGLRLDLRSALREAIETGRAASRESVKVQTGNAAVELVSIIVEPLPERDGGQPLFLVLFNECTSVTPLEPVVVGGDQGADSAERLEAELRDARDRLQATIEEYETTLEELKSANEELISLNEEMQSSNEELESSKEELQSLNEELQTANHELSSKVEELDRANSDLLNLFASTQIATVFLDRNLVIRSFTPAAAKMFNIIASDLGRPLTDLAINLDYRDFQTDIRAVLSTGEPIERRIHKDEDEAPYYLARLTSYRDSSQRIDGVVATFVDVTSLAKSELLNALAQMAMGLAHELTQPLAAAASYLNAARRLLKLPAESRADNVEDTLKNAADQIMRAGRIISHLRQFVARGESDKTTRRLHDLIHEAYEPFIAEANRKNVSVTFRLNAQNDNVLIDKIQITQVLVNLIRNAIEAMSNTQKRELIISTSSVENDMVRIDVADTGVGLSEEVKSKLFQPCSTNKKNSMGVGLSISRSIVEAHYGKIWAQPNPDGGTILSFTLPLATPEINR